MLMDTPKILWPTRLRIKAGAPETKTPDRKAVGAFASTSRVAAGKSGVLLDPLVSSAIWL
jgi:hypothetical protein